MTEREGAPIRNLEPPHPSAGLELVLSPPGPPASTNVNLHRIHELETENLRLHRLVAELLIKNQELRAGSESSDGWLFE